MKQLTALIVAVVVALALAGCGGGGGSSTPNVVQTNHMRQLKPGDTFHWKSTSSSGVFLFEQHVDAYQTDIVKLVDGEGSDEPGYFNYISYTDSNWIRFYDGQGLDYYWDIPKTLAAGDISSTHSNPPAVATITGPEVITVPAGTFYTYKFVSALGTDTTWWYAPAIGDIVKETDSSDGFERVLTSYTLAN